MHNGSRLLERCLAAIRQSDFTAYELIVVDDSSSEDIRPIAERFDARWIRIGGGPFGPANARNRGSQSARGVLLFFTDSDVEVHPDTLRLAADAFSDPSVDAVFGSYDLTPGDGSFLSQYKNLFHHYVHQDAHSEASTFWSGCGAIRKDVFLAAGGFDTIYRRPSIEDIDFGLKLKLAGGRILLRKDIHVRHLKRWTFSSLIHTEVFDRGIPWTRLILNTRHVPGDLNLKPRERVSALICLAAIGTLLLSPFQPLLALVSLVLFSIFVSMNLHLYSFFSRARGLWFAARTIPMHMLYYLYSAVSLGLGVLSYLLKPNASKDSVTATSRRPLEPAE